MKIFFFVCLTLFIVGSLSGSSTVCAGEREQTRFYDASGRSIGTASPEGVGSVRFRDASGRTTGTSTTTSQGTTFYDARGNVTGRSSAPQRPR